MTTKTQASDRHTAVTTGWTSPSNAFAIVGDNIYATAASVKNATVDGDFGFPSLGLDASAVISAVRIVVEWGMTATVTGGTLGVQARNNSVADAGAETTQTSAVEGQATKTLTTLPSVTDLNTAGRVVARVRTTKGNTSTAMTGNLDFVRLEVDYTIQQTATDSMTQSDVSARVLNAPRSTTESDAQSDVAERVVAAPRSSTDSATQSDSASRVSTAPRSTTDSGTQSDSASRAAEASRATADAATQVDSASRTIDGPRNAADASSQSDAPSRSASTSRDATDASSSADSPSRFTTTSRDAADVASSGDSTARSSDSSRAAADAASTSDASSRSAASSRLTSDATSAADALARSSSSSRAAVDSASSGDSASRGASLSRSASESFTMSDLATAVVTGAGPVSYGWATTIARVVVTSQTSSAFYGTGYRLDDPSYTWDVAGSISGTSVTFTLTYTGVDAGYVYSASGTIAADGSMSGTATDSLATAGLTWSTGVGSAAESAGAVGSSDAASRLIARVQSASDSATQSDSATRVASSSRSAAETVTASDASTRSLALPRTTALAASASDAATVVVSHVRSTTDSATTSDSAAAVRTAASRRFRVPTVGYEMVVGY